MALPMANAPKDPHSHPPDYPVVLTVAGRRCLVVGAGPVAARKVRGLLRAGARVTVVAPRWSETMQRLVREWDEDAAVTEGGTGMAQSSSTAAPTARVRPPTTPWWSRPPAQRPWTPRW